MTLLDDPRPISADSHALEGREVFDGLAERFGDDAPRVVGKEGQGDFITVPNMPNRSRNVAFMALAGTRLDYATPLPREHGSKPSAGSIEDPPVQAYIKGGFAAMRPGLTDGSRRPDDQDIDGVSAEILHPGWFPMFSEPDLDLMVALQHNYNDWIHAQSASDPRASSSRATHRAAVVNLKFVLAEFNAGWVAHWLDKLQQGWAREYAKDPLSTVSVDVLEIWKRQFFATIEDDTAALRTSDVIGEETLLWGSDYPHTDSTWPCSAQVLDEMFEDYSAETRDKITRTNVANLYSL